MSRLFYERQPPSLSPNLDVTGPPPPAAGAYLEKVAKLVPSEVVAAYIAIMGLIPSIATIALRPKIAWATFWICLVLTPVYLNFQAVANAPKWMHLILSTIAFLAWSYAVSGAMLVTGYYDPVIGSIELILFSVISGAIPLKV